MGESTGLGGYENVWGLMDWIRTTMESFATPERWPGIVVALQVVIFVFFVRILWIAMSSRQGISAVMGKNGDQISRAPFFVLRGFLAVIFVVIIGYQATWQLGGHLKPKFVEFMQLHDRREDNPAHRMKLGRILDTKDRPIAENREIEGRQQRYYPYGEVFAHPIGHPRFTPSGLEKLAMPYLVGTSLENRDDWARQASDVVRSRPPSGGQDLRTTLDVDLQMVAFQAIGKRRGAAMAMRLPGGEVPVMVSRPAFDPNKVDLSIYKASDEDAPLVNRCTSGMIPPGSIFKIAMAGLGLELGMAPMIDCPGEGYTPVSSLSPIHDYQYNYYQARGREWPGHGIIGMSKALEESSNIYFARLLVEHAKADAFNDLVARFEWQKSVEIYKNPTVESVDKSQSSLLIRPIRVDKANSNDPYALAQMSIGQGTILANPGHMLLLGVAVANGGVVVKPRLNRDEQISNLRRVFTSATAMQLTRMMSGVVQEGTASAIRMDDLEVAGKTGSAQNPRGDAHGWFLGFAPVENPRLVVCVVIENGGSGSTSALPVAREILLAAQKAGYL